MPSVVFIGGALDGQLREVRTSIHGLYFTDKPGHEFDHLVPAEYHIANGIARHESVGEEEVARRVHALIEAERRMPRISTANVELPTVVVSGDDVMT